MHCLQLLLYQRGVCGIWIAHYDVESIPAYFAINTFRSLGEPSFRRCFPLAGKQSKTALVRNVLTIFSILWMSRSYPPFYLFYCVNFKLTSTNRKHFFFISFKNCLQILFVKLLFIISFVKNSCYKMVLISYNNFIV